MITQWKLSNFKSVGKKTTLTMGPLTIFAGANSSGKSTLLQSMLLVSQTLASKMPYHSVTLNGHLAKLGQFDDLRSSKSDTSQIQIGWECQPKQDISLPPGMSDLLGNRLVSTSPPSRSRKIQKVSCEISFDVDPLSPSRDLMQLQPRLFGSHIECIVQGEQGSDISSSIRVNIAQSEKEEPAKIEFKVANEYLSEDIRTSLEYDVELEKAALDQPFRRLASASVLGCKLRHFLPDALLISYDSVEEEAQLITSLICGRRDYSATFRHLFALFFRENNRVIIPATVLDLLKEHLGEKKFLQLFEATKLQPTDEQSISEWIELRRRLEEPSASELRSLLNDKELAHQIYNLVIQDRGDKSPFTPILQPLPSNLSTGIRYLDTYFTNSIKYLGPLRDEPKALYPLAHTVDPTDVGLRGEHTAAVLDLHRNKHVSYLPSSNFQSPEVKRDEAVRTLEAAVWDWLHYLGVAEDVETRDRGKLGHELKVRLSDEDMPHDLTHVGVGVSQVLPILVCCLMADKDTTLILEQPELHLHPSVQTLLGDFFLSMSLLGKQCVIETHSEYLINRLRFRAASDINDTLNEFVKIYFVEKNDGMSTFREVIVNEYGAILDWPKGFFDQSQRAAEDILRSANGKRRRKRGENKHA